MNLFRVTLLAFTFILGCFNLFAQKTYEAISTNEEIKLDGLLDEPIWRLANTATDFVVNYPDFGSVSKFKSNCYLVYGEEALFVSGEFYDSKPDSVSYTLSQRDDTGNADWMAVTLDTYGKKQNAFVFIVTAAGVEIDGLLNEDNFDVSWNAVWKSAVRRRDFGWSFEIRIPYSAIRFPKQEVQTWSVNFKRSIRRNRESSFWNPVNPQSFGELQQAGNLTGVKGIKPPLRLSFTPYITAYAEQSSLSDDVSYRINGGMDLKYGISEAFTLDMTLIPDFGQTRSDNQVLNLSPFEVRFNENRAFFTEGTELFNIGDVFYSRRIGGRPFYSNRVYDEVGEGEVLTDLSSESPLLNATKVSGRTKGNLGIGVFNAVEGETFGTIKDTLTGESRTTLSNPFTNYNVIALSQNLKNNSSVSFLNSNVTRAGNARDANVSVVTSKFFSKNRDYSLFTGIRVSDIFENNEHTLGHTAYANFSKVQGTWRYGFFYYEESDTYDPNDLGFLQQNNAREYGVNLSWNDYKPKGRFLRKWGDINVQYATLYFPNLYDQFYIDGGIRGTFRNFLTSGIGATIAPFGQMNHFESRTFGKPVFFEPLYGLNAFYSSDYSKTFALDVRGRVNLYTGTNRKDQNINVSPRVRVSDRCFIVLGTSFDNLNNDFGYVFVDDGEYSEEVILGTRNRQIVSNTISSEFIFTKRMGIDLQLRHYWQSVEYLGFNKLGEDALRKETNYLGIDEDGNSLHNLSFNAFSIDLNYRWVFIPGSELRIVYKNNILGSKSELDSNYFESLTYLFNESQINTISMRFLVFVDALYFRGLRKGKKL